MAQLAREIPLLALQPGTLDDVFAQALGGQVARVDKLAADGLRQDAQRQLAVGGCTEGRQVASRKLVVLFGLSGPGVELPLGDLLWRVGQQVVHALDDAITAHAAALGLADGGVDSTQELQADVQIRGCGRGFFQSLEKVALGAGEKLAAISH